MAFTRSSTSRPSISSDSTPMPPERKPHGRLIDRREAEHDDDIERRRRDQRLAISVPMPPSDMRQPNANRPAPRTQPATASAEQEQQHQAEEADIGAVDRRVEQIASARSVRRTGGRRATSAAPSPGTPGTAAWRAAMLTADADDRDDSAAPMQAARAADELAEAARVAIDMAASSRSSPSRPSAATMPNTSGAITRNHISRPRSEQPAARALEAAAEVAVVGVAHLVALEARLRERIGEPERERDHDPPERRAERIAPRRAGLVEAHAAQHGAGEPIAPRAVDRELAEHEQHGKPSMLTNSPAGPSAQRQQEQARG